MDTRFFFVPASGLQAVADFLATKPLGCGDDAAEFHASFTNWAIALALKPVDALKPAQLTIRNILRSGVPETDASEYIRALELYGREYRYHHEFKTGEIKDPGGTPRITLRRVRTSVPPCLYSVHCLAQSSALPRRTATDVYRPRSVPYSAQEALLATLHQARTEDPARTRPASLPPEGAEGVGRVRASAARP